MIYELTVNCPSSTANSQTATSPLMWGCGSYPVKLKSSNLKSKMLFTSGLISIRGNARGSRVNCNLTSIGSVGYYIDGKAIGQVPLTASEEIAKIGFFDILGRMLARFALI